MTAFTGVISYPIPIYQNLPIHTHYFQPRRFVISGVTLGVMTVVTTTHEMDYVIGQECRLIIPPSFGCRQLNGQTGFVVAFSENQVTLSIDSSKNVDSYISSTYKIESAQIVAI